MTPEQALFLRDYLATQIQSEMTATRKVIAAIPEDKRSYQPDPVSKTAWDLAVHIATSELGILGAVVRGTFEGMSEELPVNVTTVAELADWYAASLPPLLDQLRALPGDALVKIVPAWDVFNFPAVVYLSLLSSHSIHHRGWLGAYLRSMGAKVPAIFGSSADEQFTMSASAS